MSDARSRFSLPPESVLRARERLVLDHFHDEVRQDWDAALATFPHPRYELIAQMTVHDGGREVRDYYTETRSAFPDQDHELIALRHSVDAVIVEFWLLGTHRGPLGAIPATGSRHRTRMTAYFVFDEHEDLVAESIYFDRLTILRQLVGGLNLRTPAGLLTLGRVLVGALKAGKGGPDPRLTRTRPPVLDD